MYLNNILKYVQFMEKKAHEVKEDPNEEKDDFGFTTSCPEDEVMLENNSTGVDFTNICEVSAKKIKILKVILLANESDKSQIEMQTFTKIKPCTKESLNIVIYILNLCKLANHNLDKAIIESEILGVILSLVASPNIRTETRGCESGQA